MSKTVDRELFTNVMMHQGDVQLAKLIRLPKGLKKMDKKFIAASEVSGSRHALCGNYDMYEVENGFVLDLKEDCILNHSLEVQFNASTLDVAEVIPKKDHEFTTVPKGVYYTGIHQRFDPLTAYREASRD